MKVSAPMSCFAEDLAAILLRGEAFTLHPHEGGANNNIFRVDAESGRFALKINPQTPGDRRDRHQAEVAALRHLNAAAEWLGVEPRTPVLVNADRKSHSILMTWVDGERPEESPENVCQLTDFMRFLRDASLIAGPKEIGEASEACPCGAELERQLIQRFEGLTHPSVPERPTEFLSEKVLPLQARFLDEARRVLGEGWSRPLPRAEQILSPSDFGFHNARRRGDGGIVFMDFEYFGWDDPVKLVADTCWHPGMQLCPLSIQETLINAVHIFGDRPGFAERLSALYPLYAVRWIYIILADFLPDRWLRRKQAGVKGGWDEIRLQQLSKAQAFSERLVSESRLASLAVEKGAALVKPA